jgi:hypothetical protein
MTAKTNNDEVQEQAKAKYRDSGCARMTNKKQERNAGILRYAQNDNKQRMTNKDEIQGSFAALRMTAS